MKIAAIIPARLAATRFPNKPLAMISGLPMIEHVRRRVALCPLIDQVIVATCDETIKKVVEDFGGKVIMTSDRHERCTDRIAEAALNIDSDIIVNVQGDEPLIRPGMLNEVISPLTKEAALLCTNLMCPIANDDEFKSPNSVKVVVDRLNNMLYASREPIPSRLKAPNNDFLKWKQLGIIAFKSGFLQDFTRLTPTPLEQIESVDMLRAIENGYQIRMVATQHRLVGVDIPEQVNEVESLLHHDPLVSRYI